MKPALALIGPGKVGCAVCKRLQQSGYPITAVIGRDLAGAVEACHFIGCDEHTASNDLAYAQEADIILLAVPDDHIAPIAAKLSPLQNAAAKTLFHFSGLHPAEIMRAAGTQATLLSIHPLLPFADRELAAQRLAGCPCAIEGDERGLPVGETLARAWEGLPFRLASDKKALYHASACIASNYLVTLLAHATALLSECGIEQQQASQLLSPLLHSTLDNTLSLGPANGLTGPIVRGDQGTVATHLAALDLAAPHVGALYRTLALETLTLSEKAGRIPVNKANQIRALLRNAPTPHRRQ